MFLCTHIMYTYILTHETKGLSKMASLHVPTETSAKTQSRTAWKSYVRRTSPATNSADPISLHTWLTTTKMLLHWKKLPISRYVVCIFNAVYVHTTYTVHFYFAILCSFFFGGGFWKLVCATADSLFILRVFVWKFCIYGSSIFMCFVFSYCKIIYIILWIRYMKYIIYNVAYIVLHRYFKKS